MWVLILVILVNGSVAHPYLLNTYGTECECNREKKRVLHEMVIAYPGDSDYLLVCKPVEHKPI